MKAKNHSNPTRHIRRSEEPLPHELGTHLFALIKRNLLARREPRRPMVQTANQLTFAF